MLSNQPSWKITQGFTKFKESESKSEAFKNKAAKAAAKAEKINPNVNQNSAGASSNTNSSTGKASNASNTSTKAAQAAEEVVDDLNKANNASKEAGVVSKISNALKPLTDNKVFNFVKSAASHPIAKFLGKAVAVGRIIGGAVESAQGISDLNETAGMNAKQAREHDSKAREKMIQGGVMAVAGVAALVFPPAALAIGAGALAYGAADWASNKIFGKSISAAIGDGVRDGVHTVKNFFTGDNKEASVQTKPSPNLTAKLETDAASIINKFNNNKAIIDRFNSAESAFNNSMKTNNIGKIEATAHKYHDAATNLNKIKPAAQEDVNKLFEYRSALVTKWEKVYKQPNHTDADKKLVAELQKKVTAVDEILYGKKDDHGKVISKPAFETQNNFITKANSKINAVNTNLAAANNKIETIQTNRAIAKNNEMQKSFHDLTTALPNGYAEGVITATNLEVTLSATKGAENQRNVKTTLENIKTIDLSPESLAKLDVKEIEKLNEYKQKVEEFKANHQKLLETNPHYAQQYAKSKNKYDFDLAIKSADERISTIQNRKPEDLATYKDVMKNIDIVQNNMEKENALALATPIKNVDLKIQTDILAQNLLNNINKNDVVPQDLNTNDTYKSLATSGVIVGNSNTDNNKKTYSELPTNKTSKEISV